ncbi:MAG: hypothetical protein ABI442_00250 [Gemmatimonadaceae bacterium]
MDRPESGGADRKGEHETRGRMDREKQEFTKSHAKEASSTPAGQSEPKASPRPKNGKAR